MVKEPRKINEEYAELGDQVIFRGKIFFLFHHSYFLVKKCIRRIESSC